MSSKIKSDKRSDINDNTNLHTKLTLRNIVAMKERFEKEPGATLSKIAFRKALYDIARLIFPNEEYENLFSKLDTKRTLSSISLEEFLTYIQMGLDSDCVSSFSGKLELPIVGKPTEIRSHHRLHVSRITFVPEMQSNRIINHLYGTYVTCSRDGLINYWSIDMEKERTVQSKSPTLKVQSTWITDLIPLPDVNIICTSSSERDLRFYDTSAKKFELRVMISSLDEMVTCLHYKFYEDPNKNSKLLIGNTVGKLRIISIVSKDRGPFKSKPKTPLIWVTYDQFCKGAVKYMELIEIPTLHTDWVHQIGYIDTIHCIISVSTCPKQSMLIYNAKGKENSYTFKVPKGFSCFAVGEAIHSVLTGGPDCIIRIWNFFMPARALTVFRGHHAGIVSLILQDDNTILISLDKNKCIKIWDIQEQTCIQSYFGLPSSIGERSPLCTYYNPVSRQMFIASMKIVWVSVYPLLNGEYTDGVSHSKEVSVVLYNTLFNIVITCGFDSFIIVWDIYRGRRMTFIRKAHVKTMYGESLPVEITAATFDPSQQFLITGARNGTLKIWNFNTKNCIRNISIEKDCEVCAIVWLKFRILVMGENRGVTEFADSEDIGSSHFKKWPSRHKNDVLCAAEFEPTTLVTGSYTGELVFWRLETGQPFGMFNVSNPTYRIQLQYNKIRRDREPKKSTRKKLSGSSGTQTSMTAIMSKKLTREQFSDFKSIDIQKGISINALLILKSRPTHPQVGTILAALDNGNIQMWSHHPGGGYVTEFLSIHKSKDYVISMCTDDENNYVFTGHMTGYIKVWHMINYAMPEENHVHVCMPKLRLRFPFLWKDVLLGGAKRVHRNTLPLLLNCYKAHLKPITGIAFVNKTQLVISCSSDNSSRIWTLGGRYIGTIGTFKPWTNLSLTEEPDDTREYTLPPDIQRSCSFTTLKVLKAGMVEKQLSKKKQQAQFETFDDHKGIYGKRVNINSILGQHFKLPSRGQQNYSITLDNTLKTVPIYSEMVLPEPQEIKRPPTPELMKQIKQQATITKKNITL